MSLPDPRLHAAMQAAVQKILSTVSTTSSRVVDVMGMLALSAKSNAQRQGYMAAQFDLQRSLPNFNMTFSTVLNEKVAQDLNPGQGTRGFAATNWASLSLVDDSEVEEQVTAHRLGLEIAHQCEWELRELDAYMGTLLGLERADPDRNPIRPEVLGKALFRAIEAASPDASVRKTLAGELGHALAKSMRECYGEIVADFGRRGIQPAGLVVRQRPAAGSGDTAAGALPGGAASGTASDAPRDAGPTDPRQAAAQALSALFGVAPPTELATVPVDLPMGDTRSRGLGSRFGSTGAGSGFGASGQSTSGHGASGQSTSGHGASGHGMSGHSTSGHGMSGYGTSGYGTSRQGGAGGTAAGALAASDAHMLDVIRRLAFLSSVPASLDGPVTTTDWHPSSGASIGSAAGAGRGVPTSSSGLGGLMAVNLIRTHREELMRASTGTLDHMVIDIVASLFDQILSDPKVPPQMARQIARLQLPVLRVALKDMQFFSSRSHPVRKFVNRMASIACAFEEYGEGPGKRFLDLVRDLVQQVVEGDFDQMELYEAKLRLLENFVQEQSRDEAQAHAEAVEMLAAKETQLRVQSRFEQQVQALLRPIALPDFLREFLQGPWSHAVVAATLRHGAEAEPAQRLRRASRELILSVQPKSTPADRKQFILTLPQLMKTLNEGLAMIRWPDEQKKAFFAELLPLHAQSLKGQALTDFQLRQLEIHLQALERQPVPPADDLPDVAPTATLAGGDTGFSEDEAAQLGLVEESSIDWDGNVDIDLASLDSGSSDLDINLDGLGPELVPETPTKGLQLAQCVQAGIAYQMHTEEGWQKVRLNWVSPGRTFFIFSQGKKHQKIISLTGRMLAKLCETGRFRAFEQAYLIERAVARARKQLAALSTTSKA
ncbi:DUF1631 family protein [Caldimonas brevitalea]|uniref:Thymidine phosphorylase n=1 Tax=Caldimonas brevitalea TaxID=413882 RepID=A0A0G3BVD9_9BURK|nr:DUF1631 family protein [Caldimonas brevitalea]AKJ31331.1 thymidine phosphorylase [Caldimonas brevitalea]